MLADLKSNVDDIYPLSDIQKGMIFYTLKDDKGLSYFNQQFEYFNEKDFNYDIFRNTLILLTEKHSILRTGFNVYDYSEPVQIVYKNVDINYCHHDLSYLDKSETEKAINKLLEDDRMSRFDYSVDKTLWRMITCGLGDNNYLLILVFHHAIMDGWSSALLALELKKIYSQLKVDAQYKPEKLKNTYKDFVIDQIIQKNNKIALDFWKSELEDFHKLDIFNSRNVIGSSKSNVVEPIPTDVISGMKRLSVQHSLSMKGIALSAFIYLLKSYSFHDDITIGLVVDNRPICDDGDKLLGCFINTIPIRIKFDRSLNAIDFMHLVDYKLFECYKYNKISLSNIVSITKEKSLDNNPFFDILFNFMDFHVFKDEIESNKEREDSKNQNDSNELPDIKPHVVTNTLWDFDFDTTMGNYMVGSLFSNSISSTFISKSIGQYFKILRSFINQSHVELSATEILNETEKGDILWKLNSEDSCEVDFPFIQDQFEIITNKYPDKIALVVEDRSFTYHYIDQLSSLLAQKLKEYSLGRNSIVGVITNRDLDLIISIWGVIKAGATYVPIAADLPNERISYIIKDSGLNSLIVSSKYSELSEQLLLIHKSIVCQVIVESSPNQADSETNLNGEAKLLWDHIALNSNSSIEASGWINSYDSTPFSEAEMDEMVDNVLCKIEPYLDLNKNVLEIGCGSGNVLFKIHNKVCSYSAIDVSEEIIKKVQNKVADEGIRNVRLKVGPASQIDHLFSDKFDIIIVNSVIQYFPSFGYLKRFIDSIVHLAEDEGVIFLGDIRDKDFQLEYYSTVINVNKNKFELLKKIKHEKEIFLSRKYVVSLFEQYDFNIDILQSNKLGVIVNELVKFRFDNIIKLNKKDVKISNQNKIRSTFSLQNSNSCLLSKPNGYSASDPVYIMYTSGSTGNPKGVIVENRNIAAFQKTTNVFFNFTHTDNILANTISTFDISVLELICSLLSGMGIQMLSEHKILELDGYLKLINRGVNILQITPSKLKSLFDNKGYNTLNRLKILMIGGESFDHQLYEQLKVFDSCKVYNVYGPTETTIWSSAKLLNNSDLTIGVPLPNESICIVSKNNEMLQKGAKGEICIGGTGISRGYLNQVELTNEKFITRIKPTYERQYKTGDLGVILEGEELQFISRIDNQVKIRGLRIELEEITSFLIKHPAVTDVIVCVRERAGNQYICAYLIGDTVDNSELSGYLEIYLPHYMIPSYFIWMDSFPLNNNGKVDKSLLNIPDVVIDSKKLLPSHETGIRLAKLWKDILMIPENYIYEDSNFFELGGHSLNVTSLISRVLKIFGIQLKISDIFSNPTLSELAKKIANLKIETENAIEPIEKREYYLASSQQIRMFFLQMKNLDSIAYNIPSIQYLDENIDINTIKTVFEELISRQEGLRTSFHMINEAVVQRISDKIELVVEDYNVISEKELEAISNEFVRPFDLSIAPLIRVAFVKLNSKSILLTDMHHILGDWLSNNILIHEFTSILEKKELRKLPIQYKEYTQWINTDPQIKRNKEQEKYWLNRFSDDLPVLQLPFDYPRPSEQSFEGAKVQFHFNNEEMELLRKVSEQYDITLYMTLLFIYNIFLSKISGQEDIIIGTTIAARRNTDLDNVVGMFVNTLAIRSFPLVSLTVSEFILQTKQNVLDAFENQDYQFEEFVEKVYLKRDNSRNPIFDVMFNFLNRKKSDVEFDDVSESYVHRESTSKFDLNLKIVDEKKVLLMELEYCTKLFRKETINRFIDLLKGIIKPICENLQSKISEICILNGEQRERKVDSINQPLRIPLSHKTIQSRLSEVFTKYKDKEAIVCGERMLTYEELERKTNDIALTLISQNVAEQSFIGIYIEDRFDQIVHCIGVLKARCVFVPFNTKLPFNRNLEMIKMANIKDVFIDENSRANFSHPYFMDEGVNLFMKNRSGNGSSKENTNFQGLIGRPDDMLYINYTSGTTGKPKGIIGRNESLLHFIEWEISAFKIDDSCKTAQVSNPGFDPFLRDIFIPFYSGGTVCVLDDYDIMFDGNKMLDWVETNKVNIIHFVPSMFKVFCSGELGPERLKFMKSILLAGEKLIPSELKDWYEIFGNRIQLANLYGPTETTQSKAYYPISGHDVLKHEMPIGKPFNGVRFIVLDKNLDLLPVGVVGEIYIRTPYRALGYVNDPELNNQYFIQNPFSSEADDILYKSGDLGKELGDGNFVIIGRNDHQVKIRGFRIELDEIQGLILKYDGVKEVLVVDYDDSSGSKILCAYIVSKIRMDARKLRQYLLDYIPDYMVPSYFIQLDKMPLTSNGKINRKNLPLPEISLEHSYVAPSNEFEIRLTGLWSDVLNLPKNEISSDVGFFEIGGHSLKAIILIAKIHKEFNVRVPLAEIFKKSTIKLLAEYIKRQTVDEFFTVKSIEEKEYYPLSSAQKRIFFHHQAYQNSLRYNMPEVLIIDKHIGKDELGLVVQQIIDRHESFRTSFEYRNDEPIQRIKKSAKLEIEFENIDAFDIEDVHLKFVRPFELSQAPLLRVGLFHKDSNTTYIIVDLHHIISDGISRTILKKEFQDMLDGKNLAIQRIRYKDYLTWQYSENQNKQKQKDFWLNEFSGEIPVLGIPSDFTRPLIFQNEGANARFFINESDTCRLRDFTSKNQYTLFMTLLSIYTILMSKLSGQDDIVIGTPTSGRPHVDLHSIIGVFVNTLALRNFPKGEMRFADFLEEVKVRVLAAFENQDFQFEELVELLKPKRDTSRNPLFDVTFTMQNQIEKSDIRISNSDELTITKSGTTKFDLSLTSVEFESYIYCNLTYSTKIFHEKTIVRFIQYFKDLIAQVSSNPDIRLFELSVLSEKEKQQLLYEFNDTSKDYPREQTIYQLFEEQVERIPDNVALIFDNGKITYRDLNEKSNQLAHRLRNKGVRPNTIVGILVERSFEMLIGIFGILKSGCAYLPISSEYPKKRIEYILNDSEIEILLTQKRLLNLLDPSIKIEVVDLDDKYEDQSGRSNPINVNHPADLAYVIYTSGSTGNPKGVMIEHTSVINRLNWMQNAYPISEQDVLIQKTSYCFDVSVWELFWWSFYGASLLIQEKGGEKDPAEIVRAIKENSVTVIHFVPSMLSVFLQYIKDYSTNEIEFVSLKYVFASGEALSPNNVSLFNSLFQNSIDIKLVNLYGPTEATVDVSYFNCSKTENNKIIPIGRPIDNTKLLITNDYLNIQPIGVVGELCLSGTGLGRGYLNNVTLTNEKFIANPYELGSRIYKTGDLARWLPDGNVEFLGRKDHQVKVRGFRIELGEIENCLLQYLGISECVVIARNENDEKYICAYLVISSEVNSNSLRSYLSNELPEYMIPQYFIVIEKLPLTINGKIDIKALPAPNKNAGIVYTPPSNEIERIITNIWAEVLDISSEQISVNANFFELGGHSLKAGIISARINRAFNKNLSILDVFRFSTIHELSMLIDEIGVSRVDSIQIVEKKEYYPLSPAQRRLYFMQEFYPHSTAYNLPMAIVLDKNIDKIKLEKSVLRLIERHDSLRTIFVNINGEIYQKVLDKIDFAIESKATTNILLSGEIENFVKPFNLNSPLIRVGIFNVSNERDVLIIDMHHIISDGISIEFLKQDLSNIYNDNKLNAQKIQYKDYSNWQSKKLGGVSLKNQLEFWKEYLSGNISKLTLPSDFERPSIFTQKGAYYSFTLSEKDTEKLKGLCPECNATLYMKVLAILNVLFYKYTGCEDIIIGTGVSGRNQYDFENVIGLFVNTLPMRNYPNSEKSFNEFLNEVKINSIKALNNQEVQLESIVEELKIQKDLSRSPLFDITLVVQNHRQTKMNTKSSSYDDSGIIGTSYKSGHNSCKFDLTFIVHELGDEILINIEYYADIFSSDTIQLFEKHIKNIIQETTQNSQIKISDINILSKRIKNNMLQGVCNLMANEENSMKYSDEAEFEF